MLTTAANHGSRCRTVIATWGRYIPTGQLVFYSDRPAATAGVPIVAHGIDAPISYAAAQARFIYDVFPDVAYRMRITGSDWLFYCDDDTWVWPEHLAPLLEGRDPDRWVWLGQRCSAEHYCGGAGFVMSRHAAHATAAIAPRCRLFQRKESDARLGACLKGVLNRTVEDAKEFNSRPPGYYATPNGLRDRPYGVGAAVTFHYVHLLGGLSAEEHAYGLWVLTRAAISPRQARDAAEAWHERTLGAADELNQALRLPRRAGAICASNAAGASNSSTNASSTNPNLDHTTMAAAASRRRQRSRMSKSRRGHPQLSANASSNTGGGVDHASIGASANASPLAAANASAVAIAVAIANASAVATALTATRVPTSGCWHWVQGSGRPDLAPDHRLWSESQRCLSLRFATAEAARAACEAFGAWCDTIVQDGGLLCTSHVRPGVTERLKFELRSSAENDVNRPSPGAPRPSVKVKAHAKALAQAILARATKPLLPIWELKWQMPPHEQRQQGQPSPPEPQAKRRGGRVEGQSQRRAGIITSRPGKVVGKKGGAGVRKGRRTDDDALRALATASRLSAVAG